MISVTTVCNVYDEPAIPLSLDPSALLIGVRVKSVESGRILELGGAVNPRVIDGKPYLPLPGFPIGELVACRMDAVTEDDLARWLDDDHEVGLRGFLGGTVACITTQEAQETPSEAPQCDDIPEDVEDVPEPDESRDEDEVESLHGGVIGCTVAELRTILLEVMRRQDRAMTVREIAATLNSDTTDARTRIAATLADMEDKGLVKRDGYVSSSSPGRKNATTWVVAR